MRAGVPAPDDVRGWSVRVDSWLGDRSLQVGIPLLEGSLTWATATDVLEVSSITVPPVTDDQDWWPRADPDHPLARFGQRLQYNLAVETTSGPVEVALARHQVHDWQRRANGAVEVACQSTVAALAADEMAVPGVTGDGATLTLAARQLLPPGEDVVFDPALVNRTVAGRAWGERRIEGLREIAAAWPARLRLDPWGRVAFRASLPEVPRPVLSFTDGEGGTVVSVDGIEDSRDGVANVVVAEGQSTGGVAFRAEASVQFGPLRPERYGRVVQRVQSDLITSRSDAVTVAQAALAQSVVRASTWRVTCPPDWRIEVDDPVEVNYQGTSVWGWVTGVDAPLTPAAEMTFLVGVIA